MVIETAYAVGTSTSVFWSAMEFWDFILLAISIFVLAASIFSIIFILWGGLLLILSWWKDDKIKPAINTIRYAVIWIVITVFTIFVFPILWRLLWLDVEKYAEPRRIFEKIEEIWTRIFWGGSSWYSVDINNIDQISTDFTEL